MNQSREGAGWGSQVLGAGSADSLLCGGEGGISCFPHIFTNLAVKFSRDKAIANAVCISKGDNRVGRDAHTCMNKSLKFRKPESFENCLQLNGAIGFL